MNIKVKDPFSLKPYEVNVDKGGVFFFADEAKKRSAIMSVIAGQKPIMWIGEYDQGVRMIQGKRYVKVMEEVKV